MINKKYLKPRDSVYFTDGTKFNMTNKAIANFEENFDFERIVAIKRVVSSTSPAFIGEVTIKEEKKLAFWINDEKKYATTKYRKVETIEEGDKYSVTIWEAKK